MVTIERRQETDAWTMTMNDLIELQRMQLQLEQLRYLQTLRTGRPVGRDNARHLLRSLIRSAKRSRFIQWLV